MLTQDGYKTYCREFREVEHYLMSKSAPMDVVVYNICKLRGYTEDRMGKVLRDANFLFIEEDDSVYEPLSDSPEWLGLFGKNGKFLLSGRFMFPVRDMLGNTIALIGWFPDDKKYITTPSKLFSKSCLFFGLEQFGLKGTGLDSYVVEGIFDCLSLRSLGLNAFAEMGIESGRVKESLYTLMRRVVAIPDNDTQGRSVIEKDRWHLPNNGSYLRWVGDGGEYKDIDNLVNSYEAEDVREELLGFMEFSGRERVLRWSV